MPSPLPSGQASLPPEATRFLQRARILDATARVLAEAGYAEASVRDIQTRAGVSRRTFYEHFANKHDVVLWAQDAAAGYAVPRVLRALTAHESWVDGVSAALDTYLRILDCDAAWAALYLVELPMLGGEVMARREALLAPLLAALHTRLPTASDIQLSLSTVVAAIDGVLRAGVAHQPPEGLAELWPQLIYLAVVPFVGPERARRRAQTPAPVDGSVDDRQRAARVVKLTTISSTRADGRQPGRADRASAGGRAVDAPDGRGGQPPRSGARRHRAGGDRRDLGAGSRAAHRRPSRAGRPLRRRGARDLPRAGALRRPGCRAGPRRNGRSNSWTLTDLGRHTATQLRRPEPPARLTTIAARMVGQPFNGVDR